MNRRRCCLLFIPFFFLFFQYSAAQTTLTLKEAVALGVKNYGTILAKQSYAQASEAVVEQTKRDYLPNLNFGAQQDYGTVNSQFGPLYGFGGLNAASSGPTLSDQNWNAAFGSLYFTNINWDFFAFGRATEKIKTAKAAAARDSKDWEQEIFKHEVKVAATYLNLLAAQQLIRSYQKNLERADTFRYVVVTRAHNGLIAGVDSSQANAERSNARIQLLKAMDVEQAQSSQLAQLLGIPVQKFLLDTYFVARVPVIPEDSVVSDVHPVLQWYKSRKLVSDEQAHYLKTFYFPAVSLVGVLQTRGSGFGNDYLTNTQDYSTSYWDGTKPTRTNYLFGIGFTWNITQAFRTSKQVKAQNLISKGLEYESDLAGQEINAQLSLSKNRIKNAIDAYNEVPVQVKAASDAYLQKSVLYKNGLTNLVDVTQALYALVNAETNRDIAYSNVWQALLLKAAALGDFSVFENQL